MKKDHFPKNSNGSRPLRVGEEIRHALSDLLMRGECREPGLYGVSITIAEVRVSPDLKNATAYFMPLAGEKKEEIHEALTRAAPALRAMCAGRINLRYMPRITFQLDRSFEEASRINQLLNDPLVARDLKD